MTSSFFIDRKLKRRFFEPLVLLKTLGQTQGDRIDEQSGPFLDDLSDCQDKQVRRDVLCQLCKICDFMKGGETVTAMAMEETPQGPVYWVSVPQRHCGKITAFLRGILNSIHGVVSQQPTEQSLSTLQTNLSSRFVKFAIPRLKDTRKLLNVEINRAAQILARQDSAQNEISSLRTWLTDLQIEMSNGGELNEQSQVAYQKVRSPEMRQIKDILDRRQSSGSHDRPILLRHHLGRLASSERASKILVQAGRRQPGLFDDYRIEIVICGQVEEGPDAERSLALDAVAKRMLPASDMRLQGLKDALHHLDRTISLTDSVRHHYQNPNFVLRVHAEIALLEAVHAQDINYYDDDKYLACSKAACFCCYHYICRHPGEFVRPPSHNKIWLNWGVPSTTNDEAFRDQRRLLINVNNAVRTSAIDKILSQSGRRRFHPDSTTGTGVTTTTVPWFNKQVRQANAVNIGDLQTSSTDEYVESDTPSPFEDDTDVDGGGVSLLAAQISAYTI